MRKTTWIRSALLVLLAMLMIFAAVACTKPEVIPSGGGEQKNNEQTDNKQEQTPGNNTQTPNTVEKKDSWENATYLSDKEFGNGAKTLKITVTADGQSVVFTLHSDKETVGAALLEFELIAGEESQYGLYVKTVNGMLADYDTDKTYWGFFKGGEYMSTGVDSTAFNNGDSFELVKTK